MPKLEFEAVKHKFGNDEDAASYFLLVALYKKHLQGEQENHFLNAKTIEGMLGVLDEKQLLHSTTVISAVPWKNLKELKIKVLQVV